MKEEARDRMLTEAGNGCVVLRSRDRKFGFASTLVLAAAVLLLNARATWAGLAEQHCFSKNNTLYALINTTDDSDQVTSMALVSSGQAACAEVPLGGVLTAVAGGDSLLPNRKRTSVLGNFATNQIVSCAANFDPNANNNFGAVNRMVDAVNREYHRPDSP